MDRPADNPRREYRPTGSRAPVVWSSELWAQIIQALRTGAPRSCACMYVGVSQARFYEWLSDSEEMRAEVEQAEAVAV